MKKNPKVELLEKYKSFSEKKKEKEILFYKMDNEIMNEIKKESRIT